MSATAIKIENLSKLYRLGEVGTGTLSHDLHRWWAQVRGKEDPFAKLGEENKRDAKGGNWVWALKDVNYEINQGDVVGIVGKNGAGKSTLLKLLSRVTAPTTGSIKVRGRIASLLEVGTGFHPELTGRENVFLNGAILGMSKAEIKRKMDEIIDFAGIERYVNTPVKRYSSGMYVRLAFAVAASLESEILVVDEVLAVGDQEFQNKCLGKMKDVSSKEGRTVLFVSHNLASIKSLCTTAVLVKNGTVTLSGTVQDVIKTYLSEFNSGQESDLIEDASRVIKGKGAQITHVTLFNQQALATQRFLYKEKIRFVIRLNVTQQLTNVFFDLTFLNHFGDPIGYSFSSSNYSFNPGTQVIEVLVDNHFLPGDFSISLGVHKNTGETLEYIQAFKKITISPTASEDSSDYPFEWIHGSINLESRWEIQSQL